MGSEPSGPYRVETFTMDDMEYASVVGPNGFSESWATAADRAHEAARLMNIACASGDAAGYERGKAAGVREEREACAQIVEEWLFKFRITSALAVSIRSRTEAAQPPKADGKGEK